MSHESSYCSHLFLFKGCHVNQKSLIYSFLLEHNSIHSVREISSFEDVWQIVRGPSTTVPFPAEKPASPFILNIINYGFMSLSVGVCVLIRQMYHKVWLAFKSQYCIVWVIFILWISNVVNEGWVSLVYPLACNSLYKTKKKSLFCTYLVWFFTVFDVQAVAVLIV